MMRVAPLAVAITLLLGNAVVAAESPIPMEVMNPEKLAEQNPVGEVSGIVSNSLSSSAPAPFLSTCRRSNNYYSRWHSRLKLTGPLNHQCNSPPALVMNGQNASSPSMPLLKT